MTDGATPEEQRVLVALDGSPAATTALPVARAVAEQLHARLEVLYVTSGPLAQGEARRHLQLDDDALPITLHEHADVAAAIVRASQAAGVALVVLTTHGHEIEPPGRLGRTAQAVIANSERPILLVQPAGRPARAAGALRRILVPLDGTPTTATVLHAAVSMAWRLGASLDVLYVAGREPAPKEAGSVRAPRYLDQSQHEWRQWADEVADRLMRGCAGCPPDMPIEVHFGQGDPGLEIVKFAEAGGHDAIVVVRRSRLEPGRAATLRAVLAHAPCPVLVVGATARDTV